ncbi:restriction endonuclease subunit S [Paenibacillus sp. W2I17]|uniref:restriction endonuclease subunit S n=1 Tax=Paenibacillus sp. W2I17 TaxID=3042311 RepID=UPI0027815E0F|nr:restriction endonuclease subunit S [Paenibacillus sp. W2I17]MDQ0658578.1 type I restriction enzyme S subunit [Paenibacillus sp. W2I17]
MSLYKFYKKSNPSVAVAKIVFNYLYSNVPIKKIEEIAESTSGGTPKRGINEYYGGNIPWIKSGELNDSYITSCEEYLTEAGLKNSSAKLYPKGTLVLALYGATVGKVGVLDFEAASNQAVCAIYPNDEIDKDYMFWFFKQKRQEFIESSFGGAQPNISQRVVKETDIPVPSLEMQKEVVTFLNQCEFEGVIGKEFLNNELLKQIERFFSVRTCCEELENSMKLTESLILSLRQSILQEAVQGKLVPQDPNDEAASVLLEKIKAEKEQLIKEKKIKKEKSLPPITEDEIPYELPQGWEWVRLGEITQFVGGFAFKSNSYIEYSNNQIVRLGNVKNDKLLLDSNPVYIPEDIAREKELYRLKERDILVTMTGTRGKRDYFYTCLIETSHLNKKLFLNQRVGCLRSSENLYVKLINVFLKSSVILDFIFETETGTANQGNIGSGDISSKILFPLPPLNEQISIVEKVDQLMALCDELEQTIKQSKQESELLMNSVLQEAFNSTNVDYNVVEFPLVNSYDIEDWEIAARSDGDINSDTKAKIKNRVIELLGNSQQ